MRHAEVTVIHPEDLKCWDCHVLGMSGEPSRCPRHATPRERAAALKRVAAVSLGNHPMLRTKMRPR